MNMKKFRFNAMAALCGALICFGGLMSCESSSDEPADNTRHDIVLTPDTKAAASQLQDFYINFTADAVKWNQTNALKTSDNMVVSPLSASMLLGMVANGVEQPVADKITSYLGVEDLESLNALSKALLVNLPAADQKVKVSLANSVWVSNLYRLSSPFSSEMTNSYQASIKSIDFSNNPADIINSWIKTNTNGKVSDYFKEINASTAAILLNTVCFDGEWAEAYFDKSVTSKEVFHGRNGDNKVDMMRATKRPVGYFSESTNFNSCEIPFGNKAYTLTLVLPKEEYANSVEIPVFTTEDQQELAANKEFIPFGLSLPRIKLGVSSNLSDMLSIAGIPELAGATKLTMFDPANILLINMRQSASLSLDEKGAVAEVVSSGEIKETSNITKDFLVFDRPFYFFIREVSTGACILSGFVADL